MRESATVTENPVHGMLASLRKPGLSVPPEIFWADSAPFREVWPAMGPDPVLNGRWLAIDLDDTLLMGSFTSGADWGILGEAVRGLKHELLVTDWLASAKLLLRSRVERIPCRKTHPFLRHPTVEVAFRPGMLNILAGWKEAGLGLVLVTASARMRVDYLLRRFPILNELFSGSYGRIVAAEDLARVTLAADENPNGIDHEPSARAHALRPRSLAAKTPWAVSQAADIPHYDLLIDDSATTAELFASAGLSDRLLWVEGRHPWSDYGRVILKAARERLAVERRASQKILPPPTSNHEAQSTKHNAPSPHRPLPCPPEALKMPPDLPMPPKVEDPLYYPLLHYQDQF